MKLYIVFEHLLLRIIGSRFLDEIILGAKKNAKIYILNLWICNKILDIYRIVFDLNVGEGTSMLEPQKWYDVTWIDFDGDSTAY